MRYLALAGLVLAALACRAGDATSPTVSIVGNYSLRTVNGGSLPYTFSNGARLTGDLLTINADGTYTDVGYYSNQGTTTEQGTYSDNNGSIVFDDLTDGITYQASLSGSVLTEINSGYTEVYQKN